MLNLLLIVLFDTVVDVNVIFVFDAVLVVVVATADDVNTELV